MPCTFHFEDIWAAREELFGGTILTLELSGLSMALRQKWFHAPLPNRPVL